MLVYHAALLNCHFARKPIAHYLLPIAYCPLLVLNHTLQLWNIRRQVQEGLRQMLKKILLHEDEDKDENDTGMLKRRLQNLFEFSPVKK